MGQSKSDNGHAHRGENMNGTRKFKPNWASPPGDTIVDALRERRISKATFAGLMGLSIDETDNLLQGRSTVTITLARRLTKVLGASVEFWMSRDYQFRRGSRGILQCGEEEWLQKLPLGDMVKFGWINPPPLPSEELPTCLRFFGVSSHVEWQGKYASLETTASFRSSPSFESRHESLAAWLRQGEIEAERIECRPWHSNQFRKTLNQLRSLTRQKDPKRFISALQEACSRDGVAVVVVRAPNGCRASGATRFVSRDKAILQLSFRYLTDDHFWFTFFHEAGHLILHGQMHFFASAFKGRGTWILEGTEMPATEEEQEANHFAATTLVPQEFWEGLLTVPTNSRSVIRFAHRVGVSPGVIVGQLQNQGRIGYDRLNGLKRRFSWQDP